MDILKTLRSSDAQTPERTKKELLTDLEEYMSSLATTGVKPVVEMLRDGSREVIELITKRYSIGEAEDLPKNSVVLQIDARLDQLVVTPYVVSRDAELVPFFKSKHINQTPIVRASNHSAFVVLHIGKKNLSAKDNVLEAKKKLDKLVSILNMNFESGQYIAEPIEEVKPEIRKERKFGIGSGLYSEKLDEAFDMPVGTVFMGEAETDYLVKDKRGDEEFMDASVLIVDQNGEFTALNSSGEVGTGIRKTKNNLDGLGVFVFIIDQISLQDLEDIQNGKKAVNKRFYRSFANKFEEYRERILRRNPFRPSYSGFSQWIHTVIPSFRKIKHNL